ncbi:MAG: hypothetical protein GWP17_05240 [Aquificales bacterium]|nr:hypothetical protein [Aquificales bacterium]
MVGLESSARNARKLVGAAGRGFGVTTLPSLLGQMMAVLQSRPLCQQSQIIETKEFSPSRYFFKIRTLLATPGYNFQVRIYYNQGHVDYAYQLFTDTPLLRWDNKEEFSYLETYPHHHHNEQGHIEPSPLTGDLLQDIEIVLRAIRIFLSDPVKANSDVS